MTRLTKSGKPDMRSNNSGRRKKVATYDYDECIDMMAKDPDILAHYQDWVMEDKDNEGVDVHMFVQNFYMDWVEDFYTDFLNTLGEMYQSKVGGEFMKITAKNINWQGASAYKYAKLKSDLDSAEEVGAEMLMLILPRTTEWSASVCKETNGVVVTIYHHDCPTGSVFKFTKASEKSVNNFLGI